MKRQGCTRRRRGYVEEYLVPFPSPGLGAIAAGVPLAIIGGGVLWLLVAGWPPKKRPDPVLEHALIAMTALLTLAGVAMVVGGALSWRRPSTARVLRFDYSRRVIDLVGFDPGRFAVLIPRLKAPTRETTIPFDDLELAGVRLLPHRYGTTRTFFLSTRNTLYIIADLENQPELEPALDECLAIIDKRRARTREIDRGDAPRPISSIMCYLLAIVGTLAFTGALWLLYNWLDPL